MKKVNITGWNGIYLNKKGLIVTTASTVKVYSKELNLIKKFDSIKYTTTATVDHSQSKLYVATTTNLLYCIDLDTLEITWRHRIAIDRWRETEFEVLSMELSKYEDSMFILAMELGRTLVVTHDFAKNMTNLLCTDQSLRCHFHSILYRMDSQIVLLEDKYVINASLEESACLSQIFFLEEQIIENTSPIVLYKLRNEKQHHVAVVDIFDGFYLIEECKGVLSILDNHLDRIFTIEKTMIDGERIKYNQEHSILAITVHCARPANLLLLKLENGVIQTTQYEQAYDCIFREEDVILLIDRGKSKMLKYEEFFARG